MYITRIKTGTCGMGNVYGGAVVSVDHMGEHYATKQNTTADLMNIVASCNKALIRKFGLKKFDNKTAALEYARG